MLAEERHKQQLQTIRRRNSIITLWISEHDHYFSLIEADSYSLRRAGYEYAANAFQVNMTRRSPTSPTQTELSKPKPSSRSSLQRSSTPGDGTLVGSTPDVSFVLESSPKRFTPKSPSPVKKISTGTSLPRTAPDIDNSKGSPKLTSGDQTEGQDLRAVVQSEAAHVVDTGFDTQFGLSSSHKVDVKESPMEEEHDALHSETDMQTEARPPLLPVDLGYLYSVSPDCGLVEI